MSPYTSQDVVLEVIELLCKKNEDYGSENIAITGKPGVIVRMTDKVYRIKNMVMTPRTMNFESLDDTLRDVLGYSFIALMLNDQLWGKTGKDFRNVALNYMDYFSNTGIDKYSSVAQIAFDLISIIKDMNETFIVRNVPTSRGFADRIIVVGRLAVQGLMLRRHIDNQILKTAMNIDNVQASPVTKWTDDLQNKQ